MGNVAAWAFTADEAGEQKRRLARFGELKAAGVTRTTLACRPNPKYGMTEYRGTLPASPELSDLDIALVCDEGNTCFGGTVKRFGAGFICTIFTD